MEVEGVERDPDCVEQSSKDGFFEFGALPPGEYSIVSHIAIISSYSVYPHKVPHYQQQEIVFEVVPDSVTITVYNTSVFVEVTIVMYSLCDDII